MTIFHFIKYCDIDVENAETILPRKIFNAWLDKLCIETFQYLTEHDKADYYSNVRNFLTTWLEKRTGKETAWGVVLGVQWTFFYQKEKNKRLQESLIKFLQEYED